MENNPTPDIDPESPEDLSKFLDLLKQKSFENLTPEGMKKVFNELDLDENLSDLFVDSVKNMFDMGFQLANSLNLDVILDKFEEKQKEKEK
jgi:hypothetical protein